MGAVLFVIGLNLEKMVFDPCSQGQAKHLDLDSANANTAARSRGSRVEGRRTEVEGRGADVGRGELLVPNP